MNARLGAGVEEAMDPIQFFSRSRVEWIYMGLAEDYTWSFGLTLGPLSTVEDKAWTNQTHRSHPPTHPHSEAQQQNHLRLESGAQEHIKEMKASALKFQSHIPSPTNLPTPTANPLFLIPFKPRPSLNHPAKPSSVSLPSRGHINKPLVSSGLTPRSQKPSKEEFCQVSANGCSRFVMIGAVSVGVVLLLMGVDEHKALALGPEGPLMEEFWDNVRRYALYFLTVSTGAVYTVFVPILELLKNPISAILVLVIFGGSLFIVSQVISAMVGVTEFSYDYSY